MLQICSREQSTWRKTSRKVVVANRIWSYCLIKSTLYFLKWASLSFHNITGYVQDSKEADGRESQIHWADPELVYNTQEPQANHKVGYLLK